MSGRAERVLGLSEAADLLRDGMVVGLSGFSYQNPPMAIVREIIRRRIANLTVVSGPTSGLETDLLIAAGCVRRVVTAGVAFERVSAIAPAYRWASERGDLETWECDECIWHLALKAAAWDVPYLLWRGGVGSSLPDLNPDLREVAQRPALALALGGRVRALQPRVPRQQSGPRRAPPFLRGRGA